MTLNPGAPGRCSYSTLPYRGYHNFIYEWNKWMNNELAHDHLTWGVHLHVLPPDGAFHGLIRTSHITIERNNIIWHGHENE